jgi:hypothetical protein
MAAAHVGDPGAGLQLALDPVQGRDPAGHQVGGIARAEEPLGAGEQLRVVLVPAHPGAAAEGFGDLRFAFDCGDHDLEGAGQI